MRFCTSVSCLFLFVYSHPMSGLGMSRFMFSATKTWTYSYSTRTGPGEVARTAAKGMPAKPFEKIHPHWINSAIRFENPKDDFNKWYALSKVRNQFGEARSIRACAHLYKTQGSGFMLVLELEHFLIASRIQPATCNMHWMQRTLTYIQFSIKNVTGDQKVTSFCEFFYLKNE